MDVKSISINEIEGSELLTYVSTEGRNYLGCSIYQLFDGNLLQANNYIFEYYPYIKMEYTSKTLKDKDIKIDFDRRLNNAS